MCVNFSGKLVVSHLDDSTEPTGVSYVPDPHGTLVLTDPVGRAAHLTLGLASLPLHPGGIFLSAGLQSPDKYQITS